jgi:hypothetical protein
VITTWVSRQPRRYPPGAQGGAGRRS